MKRQMVHARTTTIMSGFADRLAALEHLRREAVLSQEWPDRGESLTLEKCLQAAGERKLARDFNSAIRVASAHFRMLQCPIVAVLGELNAGKSSVVASFLSPQGRQRVPQGYGDEHGTHRFVYWLPSSWMEDEAIKSAFFELLSAVHGQQREYLSRHPDEAAVQYRSGQDAFDRINLPLIADDPALDELGAAFLDCPDVQTKDFGASTDMAADANPRLEFVAQAARICSAFLVLWERGKARDGLLERLLANIRARMAAAPLYLLLNKIEPKHGEPTLTRNKRTVTRLMEKYKILPERCYGAFHFRIPPDENNPGWKELTPPPLVVIHEQEGRRFPQFFALNTDDNDPASVSRSRFLTSLPRDLEVAELQQQKLLDNWNELASHIRDGLTSVRKWADSRRSRAKRIHDGLLDFCVSKFTDPKTGDPVQIATPDFTEAFRASFVRTAPLLVRLSMRMSNTFEHALRASTGQLKRLLPWTRSAQKAKEEGGKLKERLEEVGIVGGSVFDQTSLAHEMHAFRWVPETKDEVCLEAAWREVLRNVYRFPLSHNPEKLDDMTRDLWRHLSRWQRFKVATRGVLLALGAVAALAGLVTATVDAGVTSLAGYSLAATLAEWIPGIPAMVVATIGGGAAFAGFMLGAVNENTLPYLSRFFALACDAFGVPRTLAEEPIEVVFGRGRKKTRSFPLPDPGVPAQRPPVCELDDLRLWHEGPAIEEFRKVL